MEKRNMVEVQEHTNKTLFPEGRIKPRQDIYHFHKDCKYYPQCTEEEFREGKHNYVRFTCPMLERPQKYYPSDLHTIKWSCGKFEPYQDDLFSGGNYGQ